jgi:S-adenosylmethionine-diacylglycerol 3-amino-3-carboxypropyl transferase
MGLAALGIRARAHDALFRAVHRRYLIYNASWEDPRIDRELLSLDEASRLVVITGGGCNVLDYLGDGPAEIHAVDANPSQNALLQLKAALIRRGDFDDLYEMFGCGSHHAPRKLLQSLRPRLPDFARRFWETKEDYFETSGMRRSFYYRGTAGAAAWVLRRTLLGAKKKIRDRVFELFEAKSLDEQKELFDAVEPLLWDRFTAVLVSQPIVLTLLGVPRPQIQLIAESHPGGILGLVRGKLRHVLTRLKTVDNYFWRVYLHGSYTSFCRPNYLDPRLFGTLRDRVERITTHDLTLSRFLRRNPGTYSHFVLLDHQDWLAHHASEALQEEWDLILANSRPGTKILMRSAAFNLDFLPGRARRALRFFGEWTASLHLRDRVGTYGSTHLAEVM